MIPPYPVERPYISLSENEKTELVKRFNSLNLGDSLDQVVLKVGKPYDDYVTADKKNGKFINHYIRYYFYKLKSKSVNEKFDQSITLFFSVQIKSELLK